MPDADLFLCMREAGAGYIKVGLSPLFFSRLACSANIMIDVSTLTGFFCLSSLVRLSLSDGFTPDSLTVLDSLIVFVADDWMLLVLVSMLCVRDGEPNVAVDLEFLSLAVTLDLNGLDTSV